MTSRLPVRFDAAGRDRTVRGMTTPLGDMEIAAALRTLPGWTRRGETLTRVYRFAFFRDALAFMVRGGFEAEALNHHPEWTNVYDRVSVVLTTHDAGGRVTAKDVELARRLDAAAGRAAVP